MEVETGMLEPTFWEAKVPWVWVMEAPSPETKPESEKLAGESVAVVVPS
jgi:hypothetical protein